jgi:phospholipid/cholesterol/gamma-HCH transport system ATP-binding protein
MPAEDRETVIKVDNLTALSGDQRVLNGLSFGTYREEVLGLIGISGTGKSVLLDNLIGLTEPDEGSVQVLGQPVHQLPREGLNRLRRRWGVLFQQGALFSAFNVFQNIAFPMRELCKEGAAIDEDMIRELVQLKLSMVGLEPEAAWKYPSELSGGMAKRVALARALALEAELLFLDEPTAGLDPISASEIDTLLINLREEMRLSAFMITSDLQSLAALCDRIAVLDRGRLLTVGTLEEVTAFDHPLVQQIFQRRPGDEILRALPPY